ncbi:uncharacterized protein LOC130807610 isoform X2 [Amaranthus tricolor]|uniref:uncharacterized protein LOC130807610 isoform X2 n=1 Tax=Amaranthus tricolor TaxID=29722 RepID=UPI00258437F6|nr:uncharacterized protein LOC130807610 isoform X2 [Amaranthus tricolor]
MENMSRRRLDWSIKGLLRLILLVSFVWLSLVGLLAYGDQAKSTKILHNNNNNVNKHDQHVKHEESVTIGRGKVIAHSEVDFNYMSKRKVPSGPDPIHNRRARNSRRPPGEA